MGIARACPALLEIDLKNCSEINAEGVASLGTHCKQLRSVTPPRCRMSSVSRFCFIIITLIISYVAWRSRKVTLNGVMEGGCDDNAVLSLVTNCKELEHLDLGYCEGLTEEALESIGSMLATEAC